MCTLSLPQENKNEIEKELFIKHVHTTDSLEGNTLTSNEVRKHFNYKVIPENKDKNEVKQINNLISTKQWLDKSSVDIDEVFIKTSINQ